MYQPSYFPERSNCYDLAKRLDWSEGSRIIRRIAKQRLLSLPKMQLLTYATFSIKIKFGGKS